MTPGEVVLELEIGDGEEEGREGEEDEEGAEAETDGGRHTQA